MHKAPTPPLTAADLIALARSESPGSDCPVCTALVCPGWESMPATFNAPDLLCVGTLRQPEVEDPTLKEHHPRGTHSWSADAPIAPAFFPYNRCDVWVCRHCRRPFLRYTEYGGYYEDERIREVKAELVDDAPL